MPRLEGLKNPDWNEGVGETDRDRESDRLGRDGAGARPPPSDEPERDRAVGTGGGRIENPPGLFTGGEL